MNERRGVFWGQVLATALGLVAVCGGLLALTGITLHLVATAGHQRYGADANPAFWLANAYIGLGIPLAVVGGILAARIDRRTRRVSGD